MTGPEAAEILGILQPAFAFMPETLDMWADELQQLSDPDAARRVAHAFRKNATSRYVPAFGTFLADYNRWKERLEAERGDPAIALDQRAEAIGDLSRTKVPTLREGLEVAWRQYEQECIRDGRTPNRAQWERYLGAGREERRTDPRFNRGYDPRHPFSQP